MAQGNRGDQCPDSNVVRLGGQRIQEGPRVKPDIDRSARIDEVVGKPGAIESQFFQPQGAHVF